MTRALTTAAAVALVALGPANAQTLKEQEMCAAQAKKYFQEQAAASVQSSDYQSHYNTRLGKCLVLINRMLSSPVPGALPNFEVELSDAYERHMYAQYFWIPSPGKKYWEVPPMICELTPTLAEKQLCENREQFDALVSPFMTQ